MEQPIFYTKQEVRCYQNIALSAMIKFMEWEFEYNTQIKEEQKTKIIKLQS
jgi:hypothetical protein